MSEDERWRRNLPHAVCRLNEYGLVYRTAIFELSREPEMGFLKDAKDQAAQQKTARVARSVAREHSGLEYRVDMIREKLVGDHVGHDALEKMLNDRAAEGWTLKSITKAEVQGRVMGGTEGLLVVFERPTAAMAA